MMVLASDGKVHSEREDPGSLALKIAIYGKSGIGKSTMTGNLAAERGGEAGHNGLLPRCGRLS